MRTIRLIAEASALVVLRCVFNAFHKRYMPGIPVEGWREP